MTGWHCGGCDTTIAHGQTHRCRPLMGFPTVVSDLMPPNTVAMVSPPDPAAPELTVHKMASYMVVSDELLMDAGLIPDTRPPAPPPSRRTRLRWWWTAWRERVGRRVGSWIAGIDLTGDDE